jgi:predicted  nucleic acid-binding Zn-ribbon protein
MSNKARKESHLVQSVLALDNHLTELERVGTKINSTDMTADIDLEFIQKLMARFAECGQGVSTEVANLSAHLQEAQTRAESIAQGVGRQAELFAARRKEQNDRMEEFQILSERVRNLNAGIGQFRDDPAALEAQLTSLLEDLDKLRLSARNSRMRSLEKHAESLGQALQAARKKLENLLRGGL